MIKASTCWLFSFSGLVFNGVVLNGVVLNGGVFGWLVLE
jgi:hypothetical protein